MKRNESKVQLTREEVQWLARVRAITVVVYVGIFAAVMLAPAGEGVEAARPTLPAAVAQR